MPQEKDRIYIAIDLKSFYASVECMERRLDPLKTHLVVADESRTEKTICLAVSPSLKAYGISGRARLFEVVQRVKEVNEERRREAPGRRLTGSSWVDREVKENPSLALDYIVAKPRMAYYIEYSTRIYDIYLKYVSAEDIHVYSIDEVFIDATDYLDTYGLTPHDFAMTMIRDVLKNTGITATAGIGTNMYLAKIAMDIEAKHREPDEDGVRIAYLDERLYREKLWTHRPLTDFWRIGKGYARRLEEQGLYTMGDIARCSLGGPMDYYNEGLLYKIFGINAELLIDHAWGWEPCRIRDIKNYRPSTNSLSSGQVLPVPYDFEHAALIVREMTEQMSLDLVAKGLVTDQMVLTINYDRMSLEDDGKGSRYKGEVKEDFYGRKVPRHAHGTANLSRQTSSSRMLTEAVMQLYERITDPDLLIRRITIAACRVVPEEEAGIREPQQLDMFTDPEALWMEQEEEDRKLEQEKSIQKAMLQIRKQFGKNAVFKGTDLLEGATGLDRNRQIGGHHE
ncbi:MAG: DNA methylase [Firmicutes bacterium]|nr:DNA methylase [Bacillota bacterium]